MKKVIIVYDQPLTFVQGINYVNNSFVQGKKNFEMYNLELKHIVSPDGLFDVSQHEKLDLIGSNPHNSKSWVYNLRMILKSLCSSQLLIFSILKMYVGYIRYAKKSINNLKELGYSPDYIIFQDVNTAYYYYKKEKNPAKSVLILHCSDDYLEQAKKMYPGYYRYSCLVKRRRAQYNFVFDKVNKVVFLSKHAKSISKIPDWKKTYIYNGIKDIPSISVCEPGKILNIVCVGTVSSHKGQKLIIQALSYLDKDILNCLHLHIIGGGDEEALCKTLVHDLSLDSYVTLYGSRNDVPELLKTMDLFILPSYSEGMPMSILEAMRQGLYIVATETGAIPEMIQPDFGFLINREPIHIAETIRNIIINREVSLKSKIASRCFFLSHFTVDHMIQSYAKTLQVL